MTRFVSRIPQFLNEMDKRASRALVRSGRPATTIAASTTPVDTRFAQKSVHLVVKNSENAQVGGDTTDKNGNPVPAYPAYNTPYAFIGSNTYLNPVQFTGPGGYYLGLELGLYSRKSAGMLSVALLMFIASLPDDLRAEVSR